MYRVSRPHLLSLISILAALTFFTACSQDPYLVNTGGNLGDANSLTDGAPDGDYRLGDGLRPDGQDGAVPEAGPCVPSNNGREICDQKDNDCNGKVDDVDATLTLADVDNCGKCGNACLFVNAFAKCDTGKCVMTSCAPGYYDINKDPSNGCEYQCLVSNKGVEICDGADNNCDGNVDETFDLQTDKDNCGKCGRRCLFSNGTGECQLGQCALTGCTTGYQNNNKSDTDGCEYKCPVWPATQEQCNLKDDDCDGDIDEGTPGSGVICDTPKPGECKAGKTDCQGGKLTCVANKTASAEICDTKDNDCDGKADEDFDLDKSVLHCGVCNKACTFPNAVPKCENRVCKIDRCINGFANLDANAPGCEYPCPVFPTTTEKCNGKDDDCDKQVDEGFDLAIDPKNCGKCGNVCTFPNATGQCSGGKCIQGACAPDYYDTDPTKPGCELYCLKTHGGTEICDGADNNCDGQTDEGFNKQTDENNCGTCGNICQFNNAAASCSGGKCIQGACTTGFKDLDPVAPGCETQCPVWPPTTGETSTSNRCDGVDNDCDGHVDEDFPTGAACGLSAGECATGALSCTAGVESCIGGTGPSVEICDGKDNDCDTHIDEDFDKLADPRYCENCKGCTIAHAIAKCVNGTCARAVCEQGWVDNDANPDCEYQCTVTGQEICDGIDNDCDGQTDNGLTAPSNACVTVGPCAGATATCQGIYGWVCNYGASVEKRTCTQDTDCLFVACDVALGVCPGELPDDESLCDAADNDCDGLSDEPFTNKGLACAESGKQGICQGTGKFICRADHTGTVCSITSPGQTKRNELCNGKDDDCDGKVDETEDDGGFLGVKDNFIHINRGGHNFLIYQYEASRPGATAAVQGTFTHRACSKSGVLPWTDIDRADSEAACHAIQPACGGGGQPACWRLCTKDEWQLACAGSSDSTWTYGNSFQTSTCNGQENDGGSAAGDQDVLLATGAKSSCHSDENVFDMSGNAREWTNDPRSDGTPPDPDGYTVRGGAYDTTSNGQKCGFTFAIFPNTFAYSNLGFRCCRNY